MPLLWLTESWKCSLQFCRDIILMSRSFGTLVNQLIPLSCMYTGTRSAVHFSVLDSDSTTVYWKNVPEQWNKVPDYSNAHSCKQLVLKANSPESDVDGATWLISANCRQHPPIHDGDRSEALNVWPWNDWYLRLYHSIRFSWPLSLLVLRGGYCCSVVLWVLLGQDWFPASFPRV